MELEIKDNKKFSLLAIKGDVDLYSSPRVRNKILPIVNKKHAILLVDFAEVDYMDSSGVATLVEALQIVNRNNGKLRLFNLRQPIKDVFELSRLDKVFEIYEDKQAAFEGIRS